MKRRTTNKAIATNSSPPPENVDSAKVPTDFRESFQPHTLAERLTDDEQSRFLDALIQLMESKKPKK